VTLKVLLPTRILLETKVCKIVAEAENGSFGLLPRHIDFTAALAPGILAYYREHGGEELVAVDEGTLVKVGDEVLVSVRNAVQGEGLGTLRRTVQQQFERLDQHERKARSALARLEAGVVRRFLEMERHAE